MSANAPNAADSRNQPESSSMNEADLTSAAWWAWFWGEIEHWSFLLVVVFLAIEFAALKLGAPFKENLDRARETRLTELTTQAKTSEEEIAKANARALEAQLELAKLQAPRTLSKEQMERITAALSPFSGQEFGITTFWDLREPLAFANQLYEPLIAAGWNFIKPASATFMFGGIEGVQVWTHPKADQRTKEAVAALLEILNKEGIAAYPKEQNEQNPISQQIAINVGTKP